MKKLVHYALLSLIAVIVLSSCSQTQNLASATNQDGSNYRYRKEYIGNRIVYRNAYAGENTPNINKEQLSLQDLKDIDQPVEQGVVMESLKDKKVAPVVAEVDNNTKKAKFNLAENLRQGREDVVTGKVFTKDFYKAKAESSAQTTFGTAEVFALLSFIFGLVSLVSWSIAGIIFGALALVFGLLGLGSGSPWGIFALIGVICGAVGILLGILGAAGAFH